MTVTDSPRTGGSPGLADTDLADTDLADTDLAGAAADAPDDRAATTGAEFLVRLDNFEGPFDLLLQLISRHKLDITEVSLSRVTVEFIAHLKAMGPAWELEQTSQFLVVAATLLDLKAARLLPSGDVEDAEDLALLEARDLLFARLLQYRAFKQVAAFLEQTLTAQSGRHPRRVSLEPRFAALLPELVFTTTPDRLAELAARALAPKPAEIVSLAHLHAPAVSVREQAGVVVDRLRRQGTLTFRALTGDSPDRVTTVCRFLALLELFREGAVAFEQLTPLGELTVRWTGSTDGELDISAEFDEFDGSTPDGPDDDPDDDTSDDTSDDTADGSGGGAVAAAGGTGPDPTSADAQTGGDSGPRSDPSPGSGTDRPGGSDEHPMTTDHPEETTDDRA